MTADIILSVREAVAYMDKNYSASQMESDHVISERHTRRLLSNGSWPCTRTVAERLGITVRDLEAIWTLPAPPESS